MDAVLLEKLNKAQYTESVQSWEHNVWFLLACEQAVQLWQVKQAAKESKASHERTHEWVVKPQGVEEKESLQQSLINFSFLLHPDKVKYHWLKSDTLSMNFDWNIPCHKLRNTMLLEIKITYSFLEENYWARKKKCSLLLSDHCGLCVFLFYGSFRISSPYKPANQKAEELQGK